MTSTIQQRLERVFRDVFNAPDLEVTDDLTADQVSSWDSLAHVSLMFSIEAEFGITFSDAELSTIENVGALRTAVQRKVGVDV